MIIQPVGRTWLVWFQLIHNMNSKHGVSIFSHVYAGCCSNQWTVVGGLTREYQLFLQVAWQWLPFTSSARTDNLQLYHWVCLWCFTNVPYIFKYLVWLTHRLTVPPALLFQVRVVNSVPPTGDYDFAKYNTVSILCWQHWARNVIFQNWGLLWFVCHFFLQKVDVLKYTDEEYEKYLTEPVGTGYSKIMDAQLLILSFQFTLLLPVI